MKQIRRLTKADFDDLTPRKKGDGNNLYLVVKKRGDGVIAYLAFIYDFDGKPREISVGPATWDNLKKQRPLAAKARGMLDQRPSCDPAGLWRPTIAPANTFAAVADDFITRQLRKGVWKSAKHERQWRQTLASLPKAFRDRPVNQIDAKMVYEAFAPIWDEKSETARRTLGRVREVIDFAREHDDVRVNPATWSGWLKTKLGDPSPMKRDRKTGEQIHRDNHAAMRWQDVPKLVEKLKKDGDVVGAGADLRHPDRPARFRGAQGEMGKSRLRRPDAHHPVERAQDRPENPDRPHRSVVGGGAGCAQENDGDPVGRLRLLGRLAGRRCRRTCSTRRCAATSRPSPCTACARPCATLRPRRGEDRLRGRPSSRSATSSARPPRRPICAPTRSSGGATLLDLWGAFVSPPGDGDNVVGFRARA